MNEDLVSYSVIITGILIFLLSMAVHVAVWRIVRPRSYFKALPAVFLGTPAAVFVLLVFLGPPLLGPAEWAAVFLMDLSLASAYIMSYPAIQAKSPSITIILRIDEAMPGGLAEDELGSCFTGGDLVGDRVADLVGSGFAVKSGTRCEITPRGRTLLAPFVILRRLLGLPAGRG